MANPNDLKLHPSRSDWEQMPADDPGMPLAPEKLGNTDYDAWLFCQGLTHVHADRPGTLCPADAKLNLDALRQRVMRSEAIYAFKNTAGLVISGGMLELQRDGSGYISSIFTVKEQEHRGFGRYVIAALSQHALDIGLERVKLSVIDGNKRAKQLYDRAGFMAVRGKDALSLVPHGSTAMEIEGRDHIQDMIAELSV